MTRVELGSAVRDAATYHGGEGTSGYLLSEDQFAAILAAADEYRRAPLLALEADLDDLGMTVAAALAREKAYAPESPL